MSKSLNLESHARMMRSRIFKHMLETRGWKYRAFLRYLRMFKYAAFSWNRGEFLECHYTLMLYCFELADCFGENFAAETQDLLGSLLFDANRRGSMIIFSEKE